MRHLLITAFVFFAGLNTWALAIDAAKVAECKAQLIKNFCYSDPVTHWAQASDVNFADAVKRFQNRTCLPTPQDKLKVLTDLYDSYPNEIQAVFCEMKKVFLVRGNVDYGALADFYLENPTFKTQENEWGIKTTKFQAKTTGFVIEISEKNRFKGESASDYITRVSQARFGHSVAAQGVSLSLPSAEYNTPYGSNGALATTIIHEIGHVLSRANKTTDVVIKPYTPTEWTSLTWNVDESGFSSKMNADQLLSEIQQKNIDPKEAMQAIEYLKKSGVPSFYGASHPEEEFAESFMFYFFSDYKLKINSQVVYDLNAEMQNNVLLQKKQAIIRDLLKQEKPYDPNRIGVLSGEIEL